MSTLRNPLAVVVAALLGMLLLGATPAEPTADPTSGIDADAVPPAAREWLPLIGELTATQCPELPPVWVVAHVQAESGWNAGLVAEGAGGAAGLYQLDEANWLAAGGEPWRSDPPGADADVTDAETHLRVAVPWLCTTLRAVTAHLERTGKPTTPLDAMLVCHLAGCGRVAGSASGVPEAGEARCGTRCAEVVRRYLDGVHDAVERFTAPPPAPPPPPPPPPPPAPPDPATVPPPAWTGGATGCDLDDPTGDGCLTGATRHGLDAATAVFGPWSEGPVIRTAGCWDAHAWNPRSDHPRGKACDLFPTDPGTFAEGSALDAGWRVAEWFRTHSGPLQVKYLIWQGRYWDPSVADDGGWGRRYTGGGVYDTRNPTGGHYDHVHISFRE